MNANDKLDRLLREERKRTLYICAGCVLGLVLMLGVIFEYFYNENWSQEIVSGVVKKIVAQPTDVGHHYVIEIEIGERTILISETYPPEVSPGHRVEVRISSNEDGTKHKYLRLREPRT